MNMQMPNFPYPPYMQPQFNIEEELIKLKQEVIILKEKVKQLETNKPNKKDYMKKDDSLYMV